MCRRIALLICILFCLSQGATGTQYAYQVNFTDKHGTLSFSDSLSFLSERSLERRHKFGIALDSTDLPVTRAYVDSVLHATGGKLHEVSKWLNLCVILLDDSTHIHALDGVAFVSSVRYVGYYSGTLHKPSATGQAAKTTWSSTFYGSTWAQTTVVSGNYLHDLGYMGSGMLIAVVDGGFTATDTHRGFDSMRAAGRLIDVHNFSYDTSFVFAYDNHGTEVLSTMAGYVPDTFVGAAPLAAYALYVTEAAGERPIELLNLLCGTERADSVGADILSCSLGYNTFDDHQFDLVFATDLDGKTTPAAKAANMATKKGMLFVSSAGNEGTNPDWNFKILTPGDADSALTIGNVDVGGTSAPLSGYGPNAAGQIKPDVCGMGESAAVFSSTGYSSASGTSLSTPEIAGFAACLWQAAPHATPAMIKQTIRQCASHYATPTNQQGYGVANFQCAATALNIKDNPLPANNGLVKIAPNPTHNQLTLELNLPGSATVDFRITDAAGRTVASFAQYFAQGQNPSFSYNIAALPAGMYILRAAAPSGQQVTRFIKN